MNVMIPDHDRTLQMDSETDVSEVLAFVEWRMRRPIEIDDVVVFNFHNSSVSRDALVDWAEGSGGGVYVIPYPIPAVWSFMTSTMPEAIRQARPLVYRTGEQRYVDYANFRSEWFEQTDSTSTPTIDRIPLTVMEAIDDAV